MPFEGEETRLLQMYSTLLQTCYEGENSYNYEVFRTANDIQTSYSGDFTFGR